VHHPIVSTFHDLLHAFDRFVGIVEHTFVLDVGPEGARVFGVEPDGGMGTLLPLSHLPCPAHPKMALLQQAPGIGRLGSAWHDACQAVPALAGVLGTGRLYAAKGHDGALFCWNPIVDTAEAINEGAWGHASNLGVFLSCVEEACRRLPDLDTPLVDLAAFSPVELHLHLETRSTPEVIHALLPLLFAPYDSDRPAVVGRDPDRVAPGEQPGGAPDAADATLASPSSAPASLDTGGATVARAFPDLPPLDAAAARRFSEGLWDIAWLVASDRPKALSSMHLQGGQGEAGAQFGHINDDLVSLIDDSFVPQPAFQDADQAWMDTIRSLWETTLQAMPKDLFGMQYPIYVHWHDAAPNRPQIGPQDMPPRAFPLLLQDLPILVRLYGVDGHRQIVGDVSAWMFPATGPEHVALSDGKKLGVRVRAADARTAAALIRRSFAPDTHLPILAWRVVDQDTLPPLPSAATRADFLAFPS